mmetsp:Transcript_8014/g.13613  ORF Transcript_8014/g.13613 Transcript_8014/m.13613 type:complete len:247 (+) Transcript_8014:1007-1747(+)
MPKLDHRPLLTSRRPLKPPTPECLKATAAGSSAERVAPAAAQRTPRPAFLTQTGAGTSFARSKRPPASSLQSRRSREIGRPPLSPGTGASEHGGTRCRAPPRPLEGGRRRRRRRPPSKGRGGALHLVPPCSDAPVPGESGGRPISRERRDWRELAGGRLLLAKEVPAPVCVRKAGRGVRCAAAGATRSAEEPAAVAFKHSGVGGFNGLLLVKSGLWSSLGMGVGLRRGHLGISRLFAFFKLLFRLV